MNQPRLSTFVTQPSLVLGQFSSKATTPSSAMETWKLHNGLFYPLRVNNDNFQDPNNGIKDSVPIEAPVLASTERLLHVLTCHHPVQQSDGANTTFSDDSELEDLDPMLPTSNSAKPSDDGHVLKRIDNIADWTRNALEDIRLLRQRNYTSIGAESKDNKKKKHRLSSNERREIALEYQRRRLLAQLSTQSNDDQRETDAMELDDDEDDEEQNRNNYLQDNIALAEEEQEEDHEDDDDNTREDPWWRLARTFNSCKILTSLLLPVLRHKNRHDKKLHVGNGVFVTRKDTQCWLIINQVDSLSSPKTQLHHSHGYYSVTSKKILTSLTCLLKDVLALIIIHPYADPGNEMNSAVSGRTAIVSWDDEKILEAMDDSMRRLARIYETQNIQKSLHFDLAANFDLEQIFKNVMEKAAGLSEKGNKQILDCRTLERLQEHLHIIDRQCDLTAAFPSASSSASRQDDIHSQYLDSIHALRQHLSRLLTRRFPNSRLSVYGSCLSDLSTGISADVDLSLFIKDLDSAKASFDAGKMSVTQYQKILKDHVYQTCRALENRRGEFVNMVPVTRARVPVVKGTWTKAKNPHSVDGSIDFDICFLNDIAVVNSELLRQYSLVDERVKILMVTVKRFVKHLGIGTAQDNHLSSYAWMNLVIFYCQCIDLVPNLQCPKLMEKAGVQRDPNNHWHNIRNLDTCYLTWKQASTVWEPGNNRWSVSALLYGFLEFYAGSFPTSILLISIKRGKDGILPKTVFRKSCLFWTIEDPFETYDSYCPHDLGMHANETGALRILHCFQTSATNTRRKLVDSLLHNNGFSGYDTLAEMSQCWPFLVIDLKKGNAEKESSGKASKSNQNAKSNKTNQNPKNQESKSKSVNAKPRKNVKQQEPQKRESRKNSDKPASAKIDALKDVSITTDDSNNQRSTPMNPPANGNRHRRRGKGKQGMNPKHDKNDVPQPSSLKARAPRKKESERESATPIPTNQNASDMSNAAEKPKSNRRRGKGRAHNANTKSPASANEKLVV